MFFCFCLYYSYKLWITIAFSLSIFLFPPKQIMGFRETCGYRPRVCHSRFSVVFDPPFWNLSIYTILMPHTRSTAVELHSQRYWTSMEFYWVYANKASHDRWVECVEKSVIVPVTLKYLKERKVNSTKWRLISFFFKVNGTDSDRPAAANLAANRFKE